MSCELIEDGGGKRAVLVFRREELLYDIRNYAYIEGHIMDGENEHMRHTVIDVGENGNVDRVTRMLNLSMSRVKEMLYPYVKREVRHTELVNDLYEVPTYGIVMNLPQEFSQSTLNLLENLIHEYLVCNTLADWLSITNTEKAQVWRLKAEAASDEIRSNINNRRGVLYRKISPF